MPLTKVGKEGITGVSNSSDATAITIDSSENVGINSTSPSTYVDGGSGSTLVLESSGTNRGTLVFASECTGGEGEILGLINFTDTANSSTNKRGAAIRGIRGSSDTNPFLTFTTANSERMRIDSSGNFFVGTTSLPSGGNGHFGIEAGQSSGRSIVQCGATATGNLTIQRFYNPNGSVGSITVSGTSTGFNTSSDYRLKENVVTDWDATSRLKQLKPSRFNFKADKDTTLDGFIAHEVSSVVPEAISGEKDAVDKDGNIEPQSIDQAKLVPLLTKALQEAIAKIETLEAKVTALESK